MNVQMLKLDEIESNENSRVQIGATSELMRSITDQGLINPITVTKNFHKNASKKYTIVSGNRRFNAISKLGWKTIPCVVREDIDNEQSLMLANLTENIQRKDTTPWEEGRYMRSLIERYKMTEKEVAIRLGVPISYVRSSLYAFRNVPQKWREKIVHTVPNRGAGKIGVIMVQKIDNTCKSHSINAENRDKIYELALKGEVTISQIGDISKALAVTKNLDKALNLSRNVLYVRLDIPISKREYKELNEKYDEPIGKIIRDSIYGTKSVKVNNPFEVSGKNVKEVEATSTVPQKKRGRPKLNKEEDAQLQI